MHDNLFVVSRLGQLRNAQAFIHEFGAKGNHLAILYTEANTALLRAIQANIEDGLFEEVVLIEQPERPLSQTPSKNRVIYGQIEDLLLDMTTKHDVENLYLCNVDNYYSFFEHVMRDRKLALTTTLLEEGLGTYANAGKRRYVKDKAADWTDVRHRARNVLINLKRTARAVVVLLVTLFSWVFHVDLQEFIGRLRAALIFNRKLRYDTITHFDRAFVYYPDKIYSHNLTIDQVEPLGFSLVRTAPPELIEAVEGDAIVFVAQKYIECAVFLDIVFRILNEMGLKDVYFKFHPRQTLAGCGKGWETALHRYPNLNVMAPESIQSIPVEELMMAGKVRQVIGLTSTSLMYARSFFPGVDAVSIGTRFKQLAESAEYGLPKGALAEFNRDLEVFLDVSDVPQF